MQHENQKLQEPSLPETHAPHHAARTLAAASEEGSLGGGIRSSEPQSGERLCKTRRRSALRPGPHHSAPLRKHRTELKR